ncbi:DUF6512 family protein, partial [Patescibacteria group bacterium]
MQDKLAKKQILRTQILAIVFIAAFGTSLHFIFEWSGSWEPLGLIAAVNESTWEHFKMTFWPGLIFALISYSYLKSRANNFWLATTVALFVMPIVIAIMFYSYLFITGEHSLLYDIFTFIVSVIIGQLVSYRLMINRAFTSGWKYIALVFLIIAIGAFSLLTFYPLENTVFEDPVTGEYGIIEDHNH